MGQCPCVGEVEIVLKMIKQENPPYWGDGQGGSACYNARRFEERCSAVARQGFAGLHGVRLETHRAAAFVGDLAQPGNDARPP